MDTSTVRIDLPGGEWWEVKAHLTRRDRRAIANQSRLAHLRIMGEIERAGIDLTRTRQAATEAIADDPPAASDDTWSEEEEDAILVQVTTGWSYSDPVTPESILDQDADVVEMVLDQLRVLYRRRTAAEREELKKASLIVSWTPDGT